MDPKKVPESLPIFSTNAKELRELRSEIITIEEKHKQNRHERKLYLDRLSVIPRADGSALSPHIEVQEKSGRGSKQNINLDAEHDQYMKLKRELHSRHVSSIEASIEREALARLEQRQSRIAGKGREINNLRRQVKETSAAPDARQSTSKDANRNDFDSADTLVSKQPARRFLFWRRN